MDEDARLLRTTFLLGAVIDAGALAPMLHPRLAPMTVQVIAGLAAAEALAVKSGDMVLGKALPSWVMQAVLTLLFLTGHARTIVGSARARIE